MARLGLLALFVASSASAQVRGGAPTELVERWLAQAQRAEAAGRPAQARRLLVRAARRAPEDGRAALALAARLPDDPEEIARPPARLVALAREARALLEAHLEHVPDAREPRRAHAWMRAILGEHGAAVDDASRLARRHDEAAASFLQRLATLSVLRDDLASAARALEAAHRAMPDETAILSDLGAVLLARGDAAAAVDRFAHALGRNPGDLDARRDLAGALLAAGRADEAVTLLTAAADAHSDAPELRLELAHAALEAGQAAVAERAARAALWALPNGDARAHAILGEALAASGRPNEARAAFQEALRRDPNDARARRGLEALASDRSPPRQD